MSEALVATPPGARVSSREWFERNPAKLSEPSHRMVMIQPGMSVHEKLHAAYWESKASAEKMIGAMRTAGVAAPYRFLLIKDKAIVGSGTFNVEDTADDIAWVSCMFNEMGFRVGLPLPGDPTEAEMGPLYVVPIDRKAVGL